MRWRWLTALLRKAPDRSFVFDGWISRGLRLVVCVVCMYICWLFLTASIDHSLFRYAIYACVHFLSHAHRN